MSLLLLLVAFQSSPTLCDSLVGDAKELCLTGYSEAGDAGDAEIDSSNGDGAMKGKVKSAGEAAAAAAEAAEAGAEAAAEGAEASTGAAEQAGEAAFEEMMREFRENWQLVSVASTKAQWLIKGDDFSSVTTTSRPVWIKIDYSRDKTTVARTGMKLMQVDCQTRKNKNLAITTYDPNGNVIYSDEFRYPVWEYVVPDSVGEAILDTICIE